jgi:hypothetical protein
MKKAIFCILVFGSCQKYSPGYQILPSSGISNATAIAPDTSTMVTLQNISADGSSIDSFAINGNMYRLNPVLTIHHSQVFNFPRIEVANLVFYLTINAAGLYDVIDIFKKGGSFLESKGFKAPLHRDSAVFDHIEIDSITTVSFVHY